MTSSRLGGALAAAALLAFASLAFVSPALAHVTFENPQTAPKATYKAVLRVPHGCDGKSTLKVRVRIPEGVVDVKPMPKAGWKLETTKGAYARAYTVHGEAMSEGVTDIVWTGSLDDAHYDEFIFRAAFTEAFQPGATVYFPVVQECDGATEEWTEVPADGQDAPSLKLPAPAVRIVAAQSAGAPAAVRAGTLTIEQPWSRATPGGAKVGGGYVRITNSGPAADRLIGGSFAGASRAEVHEMRMQGDVMRMNPVAGGLEIKPGATVELKPGGEHLMFMDLKEPLREGQTVTGTLVFEKAGTVAVEYTVRGLGGAGGGAAGHHQH
jgi:uncharacterized protein YcnI